MRFGMSGGPGSQDPGRINFENQTLRALLLRAFGVKSYQLLGPAWLDSERYDVKAKLPEGTTTAQFAVMLQNLLAERFQITLHKEQRDLPAYTITQGKYAAGKKGLTLKPSAPDDPNAPPPPVFKPGDRPPAMGPMKTGADGFLEMPLRRGSFNTVTGPGRAKAQAEAVAFSRLRDFLEQQFDRAVVDETGLEGKFDFTLIFEPNPNRPSPFPSSAPIRPMNAPPMGAPSADAATGQSTAEVLPTLANAVQEQLGLKLETKKVATEVIVIDKAEKTPIEN